MERAFNIHEAKTHLSRLIDEAVLGKPFVIAKAGKPLVRVSAIASVRPQRKLGILAGKAIIPDDLEGAFAKEIDEMFFGKEDEPVAKKKKLRK